ncbi:DUF2428 domain containing protein [Asbolus verrucosus]|uniref:tRNA (32-2'-O)-methyltransferase regulator THADA n=1 Tax=Asbolus verrucosus TaxID=1661398 RepID=A0A482VTV0_ASBVE|nr:DUF2428 domain containing protein [Asbolus verrucosus]
MASVSGLFRDAEFKFVSQFEICAEESDVYCMLEQIDHCSSDAQYKELIDKILTKYLEDHEGYYGKYVRNVLIEFFARSSSKKNLRKYMYEKLNSIKIEDRTVFEYVMDDITREIIENVNNFRIFRLKQGAQVLCFLFCYIQNFTSPANYEYLLETTFSFYLLILEVYTSQLFNSRFSKDDHVGRGILEYEDCYSVLHSTLKHLVLVVPRSLRHFENYAVKVIWLSYQMLKCHSRLKFEAIVKCGLLFAYFLNALPPEEREFSKWKQHPILDLIDNRESEYCIVLRTKRFPNLFVTDSMKVVLNLAVYNSVVSETLLAVKIGQITLLEYVYFNLIELGKQLTSSPEQIVQIGRTLEGMSNILRGLENFNQVFYKGLEFCWVHLDHFVEQVVSNTKKFLSALVQQAVVLYEKSQMQLLEDFFRDLNALSVFGKVRMNALHGICESVHCDYILTYCPDVQNQLLTLIASASFHDMAGHTYVHLMEKHLTDLPEEDSIRLWLRPVLNILRQPNVKFASLFEEIVTYAFKYKPSVFRKLFNPKTAGSAAECSIVLQCIHYARMKGITLPMDPEANPNEYWRNLIVKTKLELYMVHQDDEVRIKVLQAVAECQKSTEEFTEWELWYLIRYFQYNVSTQVPNIRNRIISYFKKIFTRYQASYSILAKNATSLENKLKDEPNDEECAEMLRRHKKIMQEYSNFLVHFVQVLILYLSPDANYSRRSISLELLLFLHGICDPVEWRAIFHQDDINNLKHILNDSYENNKSLAVSVLRTLPPTAIGFDNEENTRRYFERCMNMACDIRPSQSLSACYMFQVVLQSQFQFRTHEKNATDMTTNGQCLMLMALAEKLEIMFQSTNEDVTEAAKSTPLYSLLLSCRNLLRNRDIRDNNEVYAFIFNKLATLCLTMKTHIMPVVCNLSPEGHIPDCEDSDDSFVESDQSSKAQMILVYAWKTMKEIMLILAEIANQTVTLENVLVMLSEEHLLNIGDFFMDVFIQTKHRGVFEQAHVAFSTICRSFIHSRRENLNNLPVKWLNEAVALCTGKKTDNRLCATRRSAGLPFLILSILPTLSETNREHVRRSIDPLLAVAGNTKEDNDELRMHCLNVLRFMFNNSKLSDLLTGFIDRGAMAALLGFNSKTWGVRNSATLLLSTVITKIFGVARGCSDHPDACDKNRMTLAVFHLRYPRLLDFLLQKVSEECGKTDSLLLHPVLLILSRLYPSHSDRITTKVEKHLPFVNVCIANSSYRTRDLAARASVSLISENLLQEQLSRNFERISYPNIRDTECHGLLLQVRHIFQTTIFDELPISEYLTKSLYLLTQAGKQFSHLTVSLYMDIIFMLLTKYRDYKNLELLKEVVRLLSMQKFDDNHITTSRTAYAWSSFQLLLFIVLNKFEHVPATYPIIVSSIVKSLYGSDIEMKKKSLHFLIYLNQLYSDDQYKEHPLITAGEVEICPLIKALVHSFDFKSKKELLTYMHPFLTPFFYAELRNIDREDDDFFVLIFLLLRFYPCFFVGLQTQRKQAVIEWFLTMASMHNEEVISGIITCMKTFILTLDDDKLKQLKYSEMIQLLMESSSPGAADFRRLSVAQFLVSAQVLFKCKIFTEFDRYNVLNVIMVLMEDEEAIVRNTISTFPTKRNRVITTPALWHVIPNKARATLLVSTASEFKNDVAICCLASWALRRLPEVKADASEVYERGELNIFAENIPVTQCATRVLHTLLWTLGDVLKYEDRSIFVEEQTLLITTVVLNALIKIPSPMMDRETKRTVICVFKCIAKFIEDCTIGNDFHNNFKTFFNNKILKFLRASLKTDYSSAKTFLTYLYNPILKVHFRFPPQ